MPLKIITQYDYASFEKPGVDCSKDKVLTIQSDMEAADINKIMARYEKTGVIIDPLGVERKPMFGDFTQFKGYHEMLSAVKDGERYFLTLPASLRNRFNNDIEEFITFCEDEKNKPELIKLGLRAPDPALYVDKEGRPVNSDGTKSSRPVRDGEKPWPLADGVQPANPVA